MIRVLLVDSHALFRAGVRRLLASEADLAVVAEAGDGREAVRLAATLRPGVVLMDTMLPELGGIEATRQICHEANAPSVVMVTGYRYEHLVIEAIKAGALGFVLKHSQPEELVRAIRYAAAHQTYVTPLIAHALARAVCAGEAPIEACSLLGLSPREREVLHLVVGGHTTAQIAAKLHISPKTVESHRKQIMDKLDIRDVAGLTRYAIREGLIEA